MNSEKKINKINEDIRELYEKIRILKKQKNKIYSSEYYKKNKYIKKVKITKSETPKFKRHRKKVILTF